jgi:tRNA 2-thiouridine synthesizing protein A
MYADFELDTRGLRCPLPILRCKKTLAELAPSQILKIFATDAGASKDFHTFCRQTGHQMLHSETVQENDEQGLIREVYVFLIQKKAA